MNLRNLIESLVFEKGEMIVRPTSDSSCPNIVERACISQDLDPSNENRTMIYKGTLARHDVGGWDLDRHGWVDITVSLLDNYRK